MKIFQLFLLVIMVASTTATLDVEVRLHSYSNPDSENCLGLSCDFGGNCDNIFFFCVGALTSQDICLSSVIHSNDIADDSFNFGISELIELGISNPLRFYEISTSSDLYFSVGVIDEDSGDDDIVDTFIIPFDCTQRADSTFSDPTVYIGACGSARIEISISITSLCPDDTYGPQCNVFCDEQPGNYTCNYLGEKICVPGYEDLANECKTPPSETTGLGFVGSLVFYIVIGVVVGVASLVTLLIVCAKCVCKSKNRS